MADLQWGYAVNLGGCVLMLALGAWVATRRPLRRENLAFAIFSAGAGLVPAITNLSFINHSGQFTESYAWAALPAVLLATVGVLGVAWLFPSPLSRSDRNVILVALLVGAARVSMYLAIVMLGHGTPTAIQAPLSSPIHAVYFTIYGLRDFVFWAVLALCALRFGKLQRESTQHAAYALMGAALVISPVFTAVQLQDAIAQGYLFWSGPMWTCITALIVGGLWVWNTRQGPPHAHLARNVALVTVILPALALSLGALPGGFEMTLDIGLYGFLRLVTVAILAYAILKHQLLGIDVTLRFAVSKSVLAGIFIAVFFVGSEAAQQFFGERLGGPYFGIMAAGALVFVLAPLSRVADRIAEKAVPLVAVGGVAMSAPPSLAGLQEKRFRNALNFALRDKRLTRDEEIQLHQLAEGLGISTARAHELLVEVERGLAPPARRKA